MKSGSREVLKEEHTRLWAYGLGIQKFKFKFFQPLSNIFKQGFYLKLLG